MNYVSVIHKYSKARNYLYIHGRARLETSPAKERDSVFSKVSTYFSALLQVCSGEPFIARCRV